jgi:predicted unusual protein kinase regulating ubiquinone biosynthesis (AarF/ABC1/UbiB family)
MKRVGTLQDVCLVLAELHDRAPVHSWQASKVQIEEAFGKPVEELFDSIDHAALASGSIAQVSAALASRSILHNTTSKYIKAGFSPAGMPC